MKVRMGFVSNSSSTSFCIFGAMIEEDAIRKLLKKKAGKTGKEDSEEEDDYDDIYDEVDTLVSKYKLTSYTDYDGSGYYIGRELSTIKDDETGKQFKDGVREKLEELFGKKIKCSIIEETISN